MIKLSKSCIQCNLYILSFFFLVSMNAKTAESGLNTFSATVQLKMLFLLSFVPPVSSRISYYVTNSLHLNGNNISKDRKHCGKRRKCWLPAFSSFPTMFSKGFFLHCVKSRQSVVKG